MPILAIVPNSPRHRGVRAVATLLGVVLLTGLTAPRATASTASSTFDPSTAGADPVVAPSDALVFHVDSAAPLVESTDGSAEHPFPSLWWGMVFADHHRERGAAVRLVVEPGTYRETLTVGWAGDDPAPLVIEAAQPGTAVVTGADVVSSLERTGGVYTFPWTQDWGLAPVPSSWSSISVPEGIRRREAVFVDGTPLVQVLTAAELVPGSFHVDEAADLVTVLPPAGGPSLEKRLVEVATRERVLEVKGLARNVAVEGMVFQAGAAPLTKHMAYVSDTTNVVLEGNTFRHSSWGGLGVCCTSGVTIRDNVIRDNGGNGVDTHRTSDLLVEGNEVTGNNVRGGRHGFLGWSVAGSKNLLLRDAVFRDNRFVANHTRGMWFDTDVAGVVVEGTMSCGNATDGVFIEATQGPVTVIDSTFCDNGRAGILVGTSGNVAVEGSTLSGNLYGQLVFSGQRQRSWLDHLTGLLIQVPDFENWELHGNTFESDGAPLIYSPVIPIEDWRQMLADGDLLATSNTWVRPTMDGAIQIQATSFPIDEWVALTGDTPTVVDGTAEEPVPERPLDKRRPPRDGSSPGKSTKIRSQSVSRSSASTFVPSTHDVAVALDDERSPLIESEATIRTSSVIDEAYTLARSLGVRSLSPTPGWRNWQTQRA